MEGTSSDPNLVTTVMDDGEGNDDAEKQFTAQAEQAARDAAAKRRQKILQKANERMSIVEGTYSNKDTAAVVVDSTISGADGAAPITEDVTSDANVADAPTATATSSRLAAMRRRRFKKSTGASTTVEPVSTEVNAEATSSEEAKATPSETSNPVPIDGETETLAIGKQNEISKEEVSATVPSLTKESSMEPPKDTPLVDSTNDAVDESAPKKKYLGVAKMRRRMIKERHQESGTDVSTGMGGSDRAETPTSTVLPKKKRSIVTTLPIAMYVVTTLLLFFVGLNIGLQQSNLSYCYSTESVAAAVNDGVCTWSTVVHSELAPRTMGGLQRILALTVGDTATEVKKIIKPSIANPEWQEALQNEEDDEFADPISSSLAAANHDKIDPFLRVDLDKFTEGEGLYFMLARFAVRVHRWNLAVFYYGPKSFFVSLSSFIWSLIQFPPILFLFAITIRQVIGKAVLGAKLPEKIIDETQHKDIMSSIKSFVSNLLSSSFPTAVTFYDIYTHLRSDMYVILCGLFVGWAWSHNHQAGSPFGVSPLDVESRDEL